MHLLCRPTQGCDSLELCAGTEKDVADDAAEDGDLPQRSMPVFQPTGVKQLGQCHASGAPANCVTFHQMIGKCFSW